MHRGRDEGDASVPSPTRKRGFFLLNLTPIGRGLHPPACCTTLLARRRVLCDEMQHALSRVIAVVAAEKVGAVGKTGIDVDLLRSR